MQSRKPCVKCRRDGEFARRTKTYITVAVWLSHPAVITSKVHLSCKDAS